VSVHTGKVFKRVVIAARPEVPDPFFRVGVEKEKDEGMGCCEGSECRDDALMPNAVDEQSLVCRARCLLHDGADEAGRIVFEELLAEALQLVAGYRDTAIGGDASDFIPEAGDRPAGRGRKGLRDRGLPGANGPSDSDECGR
jgi:hypothetical protein